MSSQSSESPRNNAGRRIVLLVVLPLIALAVIVFTYLHGGRFVETDNAYVKADLVPISAEVSAQVIKVPVVENQRVEAGQLLFSLDPSAYELALARAEAHLVQVRGDLSALQASYAEKQAQIELARTHFAYAKKDMQRQKDLIGKHFVTASDYDQAQEDTAMAQGMIGVLDKELHRIAEDLGGDVNAPIETLPEYKVALAEKQQAELDLAHVEVRAANAGVVSKLPKVGQFLNRGTMAMVLVVSDSPWVEANFTETDLTHVKPGQPVNIRVDTYPDLEVHGVVEALSPATGAEFSIIPQQNATGNWVKITQRVPVRIRLNKLQNASQLLAGLSVTVEIDTGHKRTLFGLGL